MKNAEILRDQARKALEELERVGDWEGLEDMFSLVDSMLEAHREDKAGN